MKTIYIVLTKSGTLLSRIISKVTNDEYTHSSLSFSDTIQPMYSFGRKWLQLPLPAGLKEEPLDRGFYKHYQNSKLGVYALQVSDEGYQRIKDYFNHMWKHKEFWRYSTLGLVACRLGINFRRPHHYFCSQFVSEALLASGEIDIKKKPTLYYPIDFLQIEGIQCLYKGTVADAIGRHFEK